jgi:hypothetical protein
VSETFGFVLELFSVVRVDLLEIFFGNSFLDLEEEWAVDNSLLLGKQRKRRAE